MAAPLGRKMNVFNLRKIINCLGKYEFNNVQFCQPKRYFTNKELKKFYKLASITQDGGMFEINLDKKKLKTPGGNMFRVPNEALALAVATEWNMQDKVIKRHNMHLLKTPGGYMFRVPNEALALAVATEWNMQDKVIKRHNMHLTKLCNTAIDRPLQKSREDYVRHIIHFLETDTVSCRMPEPEKLLQMQQKEWDPVIQWIEKRYDIEVPIQMDMAATPDLPQNTVDTLIKHMESQNDWALIGYSEAADMLKSLVLCLAVMDKHVSVNRCIELSRLETNYQVEQWGNVEWHHDLDVYDLRSRLSAVTLFVHWSNERRSVKSKQQFLSSMLQT